MFYPDLVDLPRGHLPSPINRSVVIGNKWLGGLHWEDIIRPVGWIEGHVPTRGKTPWECIRRLRAHPVVSDTTVGVHGCSVCPPLESFEALTEELLRPGRGSRFPRVSRGHWLLRVDRIVYMCPAMLPHYVVVHGYRPPDEFVQAVLTGRFVTCDELVPVKPWPTIRNILHACSEEARDIHDTLQAGYPVEAELLGAKDFAPLARTVDQIQSACSAFFAIYKKTAYDEIDGILELSEREPGHVHIDSLVVRPECFRQGLGTELLRYATGICANQRLTVSTGTKNAPALALYAKHDFSELDRWRTADGIPMVTLQRA